MENRIVCSRVYLDGTEYTNIHNIKTGERSVMILQDMDNRRYVLKLVKNKSRDAETWSETYRRSYQKFGCSLLTDDMMSQNIRIPRALAEYDNISCNGGTAYGILFEHIAGNPLETKLSSIMTNRLLQICESVIMILQYVNRNFQYYHMDISPSNIIIDIDGNAWLIDFEGAYAVNAGSRMAVYSSIASHRIHEFANMNARECEAEQCRMIIEMLENRLGADETAKLIRLCESADAPLEQLHSYINLRLKAD